MSVNSKMTALADAIRAKTGGTDALTLDGMAEAVAGIETGGGSESYPSAGGVKFPKLTLPPIPKDALAEYPYAFIRQNNSTGHYDLVLNAKGWTYTGSSINPIDNAITQWYRIELSQVGTATSWTFNKSYSGFYGIDTNRPCVWSSHDILNTNGGVGYAAGGDVSLDAYYTVGTVTINDIATAVQDAAKSSDQFTLEEMADVIASFGGFPNGTEWIQSNVTSGDMRQPVNANGMWVAGGSDGLMYSTDGMTWTKSNVTTGAYTSIAYGNGLWIAGTSNGLYQSSDGMTWTQNSTTVDAYPTYANGIWLASDFNAIYYSTDGGTWKKSNVTASAAVHGFRYADGLFVCLMQNNTYGTSGLMYSTDGMTWTKSNVTTGGFNNAANANGMWVAGGSNGLYYSTDGMTWTQSNIAVLTNGLANANGIWVAGCSNGLYYSTDGMTWTKSNNTPSTPFELANANGIWVASCRGINGFYYSTDGKAWTQSNVTNKMAYASAVNANGMWVAPTTAGLYYSPTWLPSN